MHAEKQKLFNRGVEIIKKFLDWNLIPHPRIIEGKIPHAFNQWQATGLYVNGTIYIDLAHTVLPQWTRGRVWSWPCFRTDKTAVGVLAHECGHYVQEQFRRGFFTPLIPNPLVAAQQFHIFNEATTMEPPVTSYEPVYDEAFAEAMRLFITNPDLLNQGRPRRFNFIDRNLELVPRTTETWREVLKDAPAHILEIAERFALGGK